VCDEPPFNRPSASAPPTRPAAAWRPPVRVALHLGRADGATTRRGRPSRLEVVVASRSPASGASLHSGRRDPGGRDAATRETGRAGYDATSPSPTVYALDKVNDGTVALCSVRAVFFYLT
jgi:hypothetical protein